MRLFPVTALILTAAGFALRLYYLTTSHPFFDEYITVLAARQILNSGLPLLPSGLLYEHGLLATYLAAPFTALFIHSPAESWQAAQWGLMPARWPSLLAGTLTIPLIFALGRRFMAHPSGQAVALLAAGLFALSPEGVVWGGRARMYALATLLVLLTVYLAYRGSVFPALARYRWLALGSLLLLLLTQLGGLLLLPPLVVAMLATTWLTTTDRQRRPWFLQRAVLWQGLALVVVIGLAVLVKRLGQPLGAPALAAASGNIFTELAGTIAYQTSLHLNWADAEKFLARQFGVTHHLWLAIVSVVGLALGLATWASRRRRGADTLSLLTGNIFLTLIFGLIIVQMVTLLPPFRRNPRYIVMFLPLFYLIGANATLYLLGGALRLLRLPARRVTTSPLAVALLLGLAALLGYGDLRVALVTPEPAYEQAFAAVLERWQPGDTIYSMNAAAAELYLKRVDGFTIQNDAAQFLLANDTLPVDRWTGSPWVGDIVAFNQALDSGGRLWFVIDTIRLPVYFNGDWQALLATGMEPVWSGGNALVYRSRPDRRPLPAQPAIPLNAQFDQGVTLNGVALQKIDGPALEVVLFWQAAAELPVDYTVFLHLRNSAGETVAQIDRQPLDGVYPTSQWRPGEVVPDPLTLPIPADLLPGDYRLLTGLYRLDTLERLPLRNDAGGENAVMAAEVTWP